MNIIVAGSRGFADYELLRERLCYITQKLKRVVIVSGTARGADQLGERWAEENGHEVIRMPADWNRYGKAAGYKRNEEMAKTAKGLVAFWDGNSRGTSNMIDIAKREGLRVLVVRYEGEL